MNALMMAAIFLISTNSYAYENLYDVVNDARACWFDDNNGFSCQFVIGEDLKFTMIDVGGTETTTRIEKSNSENGYYYLKVSSNHNCLIVADPASELFNGFVYISPKDAKIYKDSIRCRLAG